MATKYLDSNGLLYLWGKIKSAFVSNVSYNSTTKNLVLTKNGSNSNIVTLITQEDIPEGALPSTTTPKMDGTATIGSETTFARGDHIHPSDTSKIGKSEILVTAYANDGDSDKSPNLIIKQGDTFGFVEGAGISLTPSSTSGGDNYDHQLQIATNAQVNVLEGVQVNGTDLTITNKKVNVLTACPYAGVSSTNASTQAKEVTISVEKFYVGMRITVLFQAGNTHSSPQLKILSKTLNVANKDFNGGAYYSWKAKSVISFVLMPLSGGINIGTEVNPTSSTHYWAVEGEYNRALSTTTTAGLMSSSDKTKLDSITMTDGIIDPSVLPSFVDDVIEAYPRSGQTELSQDWLSETSGGSALTPETGKIYILMADSTSYATNTQFRWSGSAYVKMLDGGVTAITNSEIDTIVAS